VFFTLIAKFLILISVFIFKEAVVACLKRIFRGIALGQNRKKNITLDKRLPKPIFDPRPKTLNHSNRCSDLTDSHVSAFTVSDVRLKVAAKFGSSHASTTPA
jgi:hypothetical protein